MDRRGDEAKLKQVSDVLADRLSEALSSWLTDIALQRVVESGLPVDETLRRRISDRACVTCDELGPWVRSVITADVDLSAGSPLAVLRDGVGPMNSLLREIGLPPPGRDRTAMAMFPGDTYDLGPASFTDIHPDLQDAGIAWGAARAHVHLHRHAGRGAGVVGSFAPLTSGAVSGHPPFDRILESVADIEGWMTDDQARLLYDRAVELEPGECVVEIGSFRGRSTIVLARAVDTGVRIVAIDPHGGGDRGPQEIAPDQARGDEDHATFMSNLTHAGVAERVSHVRKMSDDARGDVVGDIDMLYIDGAHRFGPARADILTWGNRVRPGGVMLVHDSFSSIGVTLAVITTTLFGRGWRYMGRARSMAEFRRTELGPWTRTVNGLRQIAQMPWFVRNVIIKVLITVKLTPLTRILGHRGSEWPY